MTCFGGMLLVCVWFCTLCLVRLSVFMFSVSVRVDADVSSVPPLFHSLCFFSFGLWWFSVQHSPHEPRSSLSDSDAQRCWSVCVCFSVLIWISLKASALRLCWLSSLSSSWIRTASGPVWSSQIWTPLTRGPRHTSDTRSAWTSRTPRGRTRSRRGQNSTHRITTSTHESEDVWKERCCFNINSK